METFTTTSDVDLALFGDRLTLTDQAMLADAMENLSIPQRVDLLLYKDLDSDALLEHIAKNGVELLCNEWRNMPFSDAVLLNPAVHLERGTMYPFVGMASLTPNLRMASASSHRKYSGGGSRFRGGDTLMARITPCLENGKIARFDPLNSDPSTPAHGSTEFIVLRGKPNVTDNDFVYYLTKWDKVHAYAIDQMTGTSGRQRVPTECFNHLIIALPPVPEQGAIARILSALDDKIELNRRMNETLEAMAQVLFKSWFVDFDPVRAKMEGYPIGLSSEISDLFPDELVNSEIGEIPKGWILDSIGNYFDCLDSKRVPLSGNERERRQGNIPYYGATGIIDHIDGFIFDGTYLLIGEDGSVEKKDGTAFSQYISGKVWINNHVHVLIGKNKVSTEYLYLAFQYIKVAPFITGAVQLKISQKNLKSIPFVKPNQDLLELFQSNIRPLLEKHLLLENENLVLTELRDTLLPKLISGELQIPDAEIFLEKVGI